MYPMTFTDSTGYVWPMCYGICQCYVWYMPWEYGIEYNGVCGRCRTGARQLSPLITSKEEALEIYKEEHGRYPEPMV